MASNAQVSKQDVKGPSHPSAPPAHEKPPSGGSTSGGTRRSSSESRRSAADAFLRDKIDEARKSLWWAEFTRSCLQGVLLLIVAVGTWVIVDQWIYSPGGLVRWLALGAVFAALLIFFARRVFPLIGKSVRPEYAARSLEQNFPELRHSLTSYVTLSERLAEKEETQSREAGPAKNRGLQDRVVQSIGSSTAGYLKQHDELPIEATSTIRWWIATIVALAALVFYAAVTPKNALPSVARLAAPWTAVESAKRVKIDEVEPGNVAATSNEERNVKARVIGLREGEQVECRWQVGEAASPDANAMAVRMQPTETQHDSVSPRYFDGVLRVPDDASGALSYWIVAGDAVAGPFQLNVKNVPVVAVESVKYRPPAYTQESEFTRTSGAISAVDGTRVTIVARTNRPMTRAAIEFNPRVSGTEVKPTAGAIDMQVDPDGQTISVTIPLRIPRGRSTSVLRDSYRVRVWDEENATNPDPIIYPIEIIADLAPEVAIMLPTEIPKDIPFNAQQIIAVHASDADYGLSQVRLQMKNGGQRLPDVVLWRNPSGTTGNQISEYRFRPNRLLTSKGDFLRPGQTIDVTAVAIDNRRQSDGKASSVQAIAEDADLQVFVDAGANVTMTDSIQLRIVAADELPPPNEADDQGMSRQDDRPASNPKAGEQGNENQQGGSSSSDDSSSSQQGGSGDAGDQSGSSGGQSDQQSDDGQQSSGGGGGQSGESNGQGGSTSEGMQNDSTPSEDSTEKNQQGGNSQGNPDSSNPTKPQDSQAAKPGQSDARPADATGNESTNSPSGSDTSNSSTGHSGETGDMADHPNSQNAGEQRPGDQQTGNNNAGNQKAGDPSDSGQSMDPKSAESGKSQAEDSGQSRGGDSNQQQGKPQHDAEAFERIKEHLEKQKQNQSGDDGSQRNADQEGGTEAGNDASGSGQPKREKSSDGQSQDGGPSDQSKQNNKGQPESNQPSGNENSSDEAGGSESKQGGTEQGQDGAPSGDQGMEEPQSGDGQKGEPKPDGSNSPDGAKPGDSKAGESETGDSKTGDSKPGDPKPGDPKPGDSKSGESNKPGKPSPNGSKPGESSKPGENTGASPQPSGSSQSGSEAAQKSSPGDKPGATNSASGKSDQPSTGDPDSQPSTPVDEINTDYAKKATDMVLDYLDETREQPDPELLKKLDWTPQDLERFRKRWQNVRQPKPGTANDPDAKSQREDALRSLGLRPPSSGGSSNQRDQADSLGPIRDSGNRSRPPAAHRDAFDAFRRALNGRK